MSSTDSGPVKAISKPESQQGAGRCREVQGAREPRQSFRRGPLSIARELPTTPRPDLTSTTSFAYLRHIILSTLPLLEGIIGQRMSHLEKSELISLQRHCFLLLQTAYAVLVDKVTKPVRERIMLLQLEAK